jgi:hypothetical protein
VMTIGQRKRVVIGVEEDRRHVVDVNESVCRLLQGCARLLTTNDIESQKSHAYVSRLFEKAES